MLEKLKLVLAELELVLRYLELVLGQLELVLFMLMNMKSKKIRELGFRTPSLCVIPEFHTFSTALFPPVRISSQNIQIITIFAWTTREQATTGSSLIAALDLNLLKGHNICSAFREFLLIY